MHYYQPAMIHQYLVFEDGRVALPAKKQSALYMLALHVGHWNIPVTDIKSYEQAIVNIFSNLQQPLIQLKLEEYHNVGFHRAKTENLVTLSEDLDFSGDQDMAWLDFLHVMQDYENRSRAHLLSS